MHVSFPDVSELQVSPCVLSFLGQGLKIGVNEGRLDSKTPQLKNANKRR